MPLPAFAVSTALPRAAHVSTSAAPRAVTAPRCAAADELLIVGAGTLGALVAEQWRAARPGARVVAETRTPTRHAALRELGVEPMLAREGAGKFSRVAFCASPKGNEDYVGDVRAAAARVSDGGRFVFTSSGGVYNRAGVLTEDSAVAGGERREMLLAAEREALAIDGGAVLRLAGLYSLLRGGHNFWFGKGSAGPGDGVINQVHYSDAAAAVVAALALHTLPEKRVFLIADGVPMTRRSICETVHRHPAFRERERPVFEEDTGAESKRYDNSWSRQALGWTPQYSSFEDFVEKDCQRLLADTKTA